MTEMVMDFTQILFSGHNPASDGVAELRSQTGLFNTCDDDGPECGEISPLARLKVSDTC